MFNFEQLYIDSSFVLVQKDVSLAEVRSLLHQNSFVIFIDKLAYAITDSDSVLLEQSDSKMPLREWIKKAKIPSSTVCPVTRLMELELTSDRPVLIGEDKSDIRGVIAAREMIKCLINEKRRLTSYFTALVETVNDAVTAVDQEGRVIYWNQAAEQVYGIRKETIIGRKIAEHFDQESIMLQRILDEGRPVRQVYHQPTPNTHVLISASPIMENDRIIGGIATEQDITRIVRLNEELYSAVPSKFEQDRSFAAIIGSGPVFKRVLELAQKFTRIHTPVLLTGEAGSGKEMLAQAIHYGTGRTDASFFTIHCGALPGGLLETELFGYQGGAFTSKEDQGNAGKLELAAGGTLLLKDIDKMPPHIQLKLLQFIKSGSFLRIGGGESVRADTRIIATTSTSLQSQMEDGHFLEELYYKLNVMSIEMPPLRERTEDIPELVQAFIREFSWQYNKHTPKLDRDVMTALMNYDWPGNIGELRNVVERIVVLCDGGAISVEHLPQGLISELQLDNGKLDEGDMILKARLTDQEENAIIYEALRKVYGNKSAAAKLLGISRGTLYNKMKEHGIKF
jgi:PAS domain S-box-containing protein